MSEKIYLKVPSKPAANEVGHGNHSAVLTPGKVITVDDRKFADWLVREFACAEVDKPKKASPAKPKAKKKPVATPQPAAPVTERTNDNSPASADDEEENHGGLE